MSNNMFIEEDTKPVANTELRLPPRVRRSVVENAPNISSASNNDSSDNRITMSDDQPIAPKDTWWHTRTMAYVSLFTMVIITFLIFVINPANVEKLTIVLSWIYPPFAAIVMAYMGAATYAQMKGK